MDPELRIWLQRQDTAIQAIRTEQKRQSDALTIVSRELASLIELLTPRIGDGESALEQLLAQLAAQGKEELTLLRQLGQLMNRIERGLPGTGAPPVPRTNGHAQPS